jgi:hypothetical protein
MEKNNNFINHQSNSKSPHVEVDLANLPRDLCFKQKKKKKKKKCDYHPSDKDQIRRAYLQKRACQPFNHDFLRKNF